MSETNLFGEAINLDEARKKPVPVTKTASPAKLLLARRNQVLLMPTDLESLLLDLRRSRGLRPHAFRFSHGSQGGAGRRHDPAIAYNTLKLLALA
ncbi:MAG: hypothetical protein FD180_1626 [Planctomycetota bacterium]|nr:MAG: hypothetical protein FD180_1626 [Planctomycetota bacterium]